MSDIRKYINLLESSENPLSTVYHGSDVHIEKFSLDYLGDGLDEYGAGIYFATDPNTAESHGKYVHVVTLSSDLTLVPDTAPDRDIARKLMKAAPDLEMILTDWDEDENRAFDMALNSMIDSADTMGEMIDNLWFDFYRHDVKEFLENVVTITGYDGNVVIPGIGKYLLLYNVDKIEHVEVYES